MSTHSQLGIKFPDGSILGCYVHYDGGTMAPRIKDYLKKYTITSLVLLIDKAQKVGGIRSFHTADFKDPKGLDISYFLKFVAKKQIL